MDKQINLSIIKILKFIMKFVIYYYLRLKIFI